MRDLLLQSKPKDFDMLTTATPVQAAESCFFPLSILAERLAYNAGVHISR